MSAGTVTAIRPNAGPKPPQEPPKPRQPRRRRPPGVTFRDPPEGPSTLRVIQALAGVCQACELTAGDEGVDPLGLATAARILADMLQERVD